MSRPYRTAAPQPKRAIDAPLTFNDIIQQDDMKHRTSGEARRRI